MSGFFSKEKLQDRKSDILDYVPVPFFAVLYGKKGNAVEICSRKLAILLKLKEGIRSSEDMVLKRIGRSKESFRTEEQTVVVGERKIRISYRPVLNQKSKTVSAEIFWFYDETSEEKEKAVFLAENKRLADGLKTLNFILNKLPEILWIKKDDGEIIYANQKYAAAVGEESAEDVMKNQTALLKTGVLETLEAAAKETGKSQKQIMDIVIEGMKTVYEITVMPLTEKETLGLGKDISRDAKTQGRMQEALDVLTGAFEAEEQGIAVFDREGYVLKANEAFKNFFRIPESLISEKVSFGLILEKMREEGTAPIANDFKDYKKRETEKIKKAKEVSKELLACPKGVILERTRKKIGNVVVDFFLDKTENVRETRDAKLDRQIVLQLTDDLPFGILKIDAQKRVTGWNDRFKERWGLSKAFLERKPHISEIFAEQALKLKPAVKNFEKILLGAIEDPRIEQVDLKESVLHIIRLKDGSLWLNYL